MATSPYSRSRALNRFLFQTPKHLETFQTASKGDLGNAHLYFRFRALPYTCADRARYWEVFFATRK